MQVFLDANVLFSGSDPASATSLLIGKLIKRHAILVVNPHVIEETLRNITEKRIRCLPGLKKLIDCVTVSSAFHLQVGVSLPPDDMLVIAGSVGSKCDYLWTGDKRHFGYLYGKVIHGVLIVSGEMMTTILADDVTDSAMNVKEKRRKYKSKKAGRE